jgi:hypothetical protein
MTRLFTNFRALPFISQEKSADKSPCETDTEPIPRPNRASIHPKRKSLKQTQARVGNNGIGLARKIAKSLAKDRLFFLLKKEVAHKMNLLSIAIDL